MDDQSLNVLTKAIKLVSSGQSTDYDSLAINIGKIISKDFENIIPFTKHTLKDHHKEGSKILDSLVKQGLIRVQFRGKTRRGVLDLDTGRASGGWSDTISREVTVIDKNLLRLQEAERRVTIARRLGTTSGRDRLYVKAGKKTFSTDVDVINGTVTITKTFASFLVKYPATYSFAVQDDGSINISESITFKNKDLATRVDLIGGIISILDNVKSL